MEMHSQYAEGRWGLVPIRLTRVRCGDCNLCNTTTKLHERWREHFAGIPNIHSPFSMEEIERLKQRQLRLEMVN